MDITKMLTINLAHINKATANFINTELIHANSDMPICFIRKGRGYIIHVPKSFLTNEEDGVKEMYPNIPDNLHYCMLEAWANHCEWLCLDCDGEIIDGLMVYDDWRVNEKNYG